MAVVLSDPEQAVEGEVLMAFDQVRHVEGEPEHLRNNDARRWRLLRWANMLAGYYGCRIYLVGSATLDDNLEPRDWDIRICLPRAEFERRFGSVKAWEDEGITGAWTEVRWRWAEECRKRTAEGWANVRLNIDCQLQPPGTWNKYGAEKRVRLDAMPTAPAPPDEAGV